LRYPQRLVGLVIFVAISASLAAEQITGTVTNGTTSKPGAGEEVVLLSHAGGGMNQVGQAKADAQGRFSINVPDPEAQHLLRVNHQGVNYSQSVPPGTATADITIFDAAKKVPSINEDARVYRLQTENGHLEVLATYNVHNESTPPRTKMGDETYEVEIPAGAQLVDISASGPGGMPVPASPVPTGKQNRYAIVFPIRPGQSKLYVSYKLPYSGSYEFNFSPDSELSELGVLLPKSMQFNGLSRTFAQDNDEEGLAVYFAKSVPAHEQVRFSVSGEGIAPREAQGGSAPEGGPESGGPPPPSGTRSSAIWFVVAGMIIVVVGGGYWLWRRSRAMPSGVMARSNGKNKTSGRQQAPRRSTAEPARAGSGSSDTVLDALKDELFQLEKDRLDGKVAAEDYTRLKAGLDALIRRHLKKAAP
jgi:hypothetical protein